MQRRDIGRVMPVQPFGQTDETVQQGAAPDGQDGEGQAAGPGMSMAAKAEGGRSRGGAPVRSATQG